MSTNNNNYEQQKKRGLLRKWESVQNRGGKCEECGYKANLAAIEFHHRNPEEKSFGLDLRAFSNTRLEVLQEEIDKCAMLCANCHRELHNEDLSFENVPFLLEKVVKTTIDNPSGSVCPECGKRFPKITGKIYCSSKCKDDNKNYPTIEELNEQHKILKSWEKVATHFGITRKITQTIRKKADS